MLVRADTKKEGSCNAKIILFPNLRVTYNLIYNYTFG